MMVSLKLPAALAFLDTMDFKGQVHAERLYQVLIVGAGAVGFLHGYVEQNFAVTFAYWLVASVIAGLLTVPGWPWLYMRHPVQWLKELPPDDDADGDGGGEAEGEFEERREREREEKKRRKEERRAAAAGGAAANPAIRK